MPTLNNHPAPPNLDQPRLRLRARDRATSEDTPQVRTNQSCSPLAIDYVAIGSLSPFAAQLRQHPERKVAACMGNLRAFGFVAPLIVDADGVIVDGHALWEAAKRLGFTEVPVIRLSSLSPALIRSCRIALNKMTEGSNWNVEALRLELMDIAPTLIAHDIEVEAIGFSSAEFDRMLAPLEQSPGEDVVPPPADGVAVSRGGDIWLLGRHRLLCGDALNAEHFERLMAGDKARMSFTDPPYNLKVDGVISGLGKVKHREFAMATGEMSRAAFTEFLHTYMAHCAAHAVDGAVHFACMDWRHVVELVTAGETAFGKQLNLVVWNKTNAGMGSMYRSQHELIGVFRSGSGKHKNNFGLGETGRHRSNVWTVPGANAFGKQRDANLAVHPTVKPTALVMDAIRDVSDRGEIVLDCFCGSGTTVLAAQKTGRICRAIEMDALYVDVAVRRWEALTGESAVLADDGRTFAEVAQARGSTEEHSHD